MVTRRAPAKGHKEATHGRRPLAGARRMLLSLFKGRSPGWRFPAEADMTLVRHLVVASHSATQLNLGQFSFSGTLPQGAARPL